MIDYKVGEEKQPNNTTQQYSFNEIKYIQDYIKFYYSKTQEQLKLNRVLLIIANILLVANLMPNIIKLLGLLLIM